jgi:hypothetical protein
MSSVKGVEFLVVVHSEDAKKFEVWGVEKPDLMAQWAHTVAHDVRELAQKLNFGTFNELVGFGPQHNIGMVTNPTEDLCVGFNRTLNQAGTQKALKEAAAKWVS